MSDNTPEPLFKRLWISQPNKPHQRYARFTVRPVDNANVSLDENLVVPMRSGWTNQPFEVYYHKSEVDALRQEIKLLKNRLNPVLPPALPESPI